MRMAWPNLPQCMAGCTRNSKSQKFRISVDCETIETPEKPLPFLQCEKRNVQKVQQPILCLCVLLKNSENFGNCLDLKPSSLNLCPLRARKLDLAWQAKGAGFRRLSQGFRRLSQFLRFRIFAHFVSEPSREIFRSYFAAKVAKGGFRFACTLQNTCPLCHQLCKAAPIAR